MAPFLEIITFEIFIKFVLIYFFVIWIAILVWVVKDIANRTESIIFQILAILVILLGTPFWVFIYLLIRPGKTLFEKYYEEIEHNLNTFSEMVHDKWEKLDESMHCPACDASICHDFHFCPKCRLELKSECWECEKDIFTHWDSCPYCGVEQKSKKWKMEKASNAKNAKEAPQESKDNISEDK